jgi:hypothetical protein
MKILARVIAASGILMLMGEALYAAPVPVPNIKYELPHVVLQSQSMNVIIKTLRTIVVKLAPVEIQQDFDKSVAKHFGDLANPGLEMAKPIVGYLYLRPEMEKSVVILAFPIKDEKKSLDVLASFGIQHESDGKGLTKFESQEWGHWRGKATADTGYLAFQFNEQYDDGAVRGLLEPSKLVPYSALVNEQEKSLLSANLYLDRVPEGAKKHVGTLLTMLENLAEQEPADPPALKRLAVQATRSLNANATRGLKEGLTVTGKLNIDPQTGVLDLNFALTPSKGTPLVADIAAIKSFKSRAAALSAPETVVGGWLSLPAGLPKDLRDAAGPAFVELFRSLETELPESARPLLGEISKQLATGIVDEKFDLGFTLVGPNKDGHHTGVAFVQMDKPGALVQAVLKLSGGKEIPKDFKDRLKLNAAKVGDLAVHTMDLSKLLPEVELFGEKQILHFAFEKSAFILAIGPDALNQIKRATELKPVEATAFEMQLNPKRLADVIAKNNPNTGQLVQQQFGKLDQLVPLYRLDVRGGEQLQIRGGTWFLGMSGLFFIP